MLCNWHFPESTVEVESTLSVAPFMSFSSFWVQGINQEKRILTALIARYSIVIQNTEGGSFGMKVGVRTILDPRLAKQILNTKLHPEFFP